jgi:hypothetical protein
MPSTDPLGPTSRAARIVVAPAPEPRSTTCTPGRRPAWASTWSVTGSKRRACATIRRSSSARSLAQAYGSGSEATVLPNRPAP